MPSPSQGAGNLMMRVDSPSLSFMPFLQSWELLEVHLPRDLAFSHGHIEGVVDLGILLQLRGIHTVEVAEVDGLRHLPLLLGEVLDGYAQNPRSHLTVGITSREKHTHEGGFLRDVCGDSEFDL